MKDFLISSPGAGISSSPLTGNADVRNVDINSIPGVIKLNNILSKVSGSTVTALVKWAVRDPVTTANIYAVDSAGDVYVSTDSGASFAALGTQPTSGGKGQGLAIWKDYLFCPRATAMDLYGPLSSSPAWRNSWAGLTMDTDALWHPMIVSKNDNKLYGGAGKYIFSIDEVTAQTFAWDDAGTYTATAQALDLPESYRIKCLEELGNNLMIGTWKGTNVYDFRVADIFPWDRSSVSFGQPIIMQEFGVNALLNINSVLYILAGISGKVYSSNGVQVNLIAQIPQSVADISGGKYLETYPGALVSYKDKLFFGISGGGTGTIDGMGVYSLLQTSRGNILTLEHSISSLNYGASAVLKIGALLPVTRDTLVVGFQDTTFGLDLSSATSYAYGTDYSGYFLSAFYQVGTPLVKRAFTQIEFQLSKELATGEGIKVEYRINLTDSFTTIDTWTFAKLGAITSFNAIADIPACEALQLKISLLGTATTSPEFRNLTLR